MEPATAKRVLQALADGVDPRTGQALPPGSVLEAPEVIRALHAALAAMDAEIRRRERASALPENAGKSWTLEDDHQLALMFDMGKSVAEIARSFGRTEGAIASRLVRLGKIPDRDSAYGDNARKKPPADGPA